MKTNKKMMVAIAAVMCGAVCLAAPGPGGRGGPIGGRGGAPMMRGGGVRHHGGGSFWGRGGRNFWPGFVGGIVGGALVDAVVGPSYYYSSPSVVVTTPVVTTPVVTTPVVTTQTVWVEGRYVDQVQPNGTVVRVWQPGHYETRQVTY